jgi:hypothetical protein
VTERPSSRAWLGSALTPGTSEPPLAVIPGREATGAGEGALTQVEITPLHPVSEPSAGWTRDDGRISTREFVTGGHLRTSAVDYERAGDGNRTRVLSLGRR